MNRIDAIALMSTSKNVEDWNANRATVLSKLNEITEYKCSVGGMFGGDKYEVTITLPIPEWFHADIDGSGLINKILKR